MKLDAGPTPRSRQLRTTAATTMNAALGSLAALAVLGAGGCSYQLASPPARMMNLQSAKTAAPGETVVGVRGAGYASIFDPGAVVASAGVRHGIAEDVEVDAEASWARLDEEGYGDLDRNIYAARVGAKVSRKSGWAAAFAGAGGGYAPVGGAFSAVDAGVAVSYPNCYVVPFTNLTLFGSLPIGAKQVDFRNATDGSVAASSKATFTYGVGWGGGVELPLDRARCRQGLTPARLQLGLSSFTLVPRPGNVIRSSTSSDTMYESTTTGRYSVVGLALGVEVPF